MVSGRYLGHDAAIGCVKIHLAVKRIGQQPLFRVEEGHTRLVTARFQSQYQHRRRIIHQAVIHRRNAALKKRILLCNMVPPRILCGVQSRPCAGFLYI